MIKIACNYTSETIVLLDEGNVKIDYIKYPSLANDEGFKDYTVFKKNIENIKERKPVLYHGTFPSNIFIGNREFLDNFDVDAFREICELSGTHGISLHFSGGDSDMTREETVSVAVKNISFVKECFPQMDFIAIENLPRSNNPFEQDPSVISEVVKKAEINFLYDISHAFKYSYDNGLAFEDYVSSLPLDKIHEVHINGWQIKNLDVQAHMCIQDDLYEHIEWIVKNTPVEIMTLEYGRHNDRIDCGCPIVKLGQINLEAKTEIKKQLDRLYLISQSI